MLLNDRNFNENEGIFEVVTDEDCLHAIARWTANLLGNICRSNCSDVVLTTLDYLLNNVKPTVKSL